MHALDLVFMGTAEFAVPSLRAIVAAGHRVRAVVTQPDRPRGRGWKPQESPVKRAARELDLPVLQPEKASEPGFVEHLRQLAPQVIAVAAYGQILKPAVLQIPPLGCVNVHASLLPELRGAAPIQWAIIRGYRETGVTTFFMDEGMDTGDVILQRAVAIDPDDTAGSLAERLAPLGAELLVETLALLEAGRAPRIPQDPARATYAPMLRREDGAIRWDQPAEAIRNRIHGCNPAPGAYARRGEAVVKLWRAKALPESALPSWGGRPVPGTVIDARQLVIAAGEGAVRLVEVQPPNRARMTGDAFCRGYRVAAGEVWLPG